VQCHGLDQHVTATVREVLLEVVGAPVTKVDRLDRKTQEQAGDICRPGHVDLLVADAAGNSTLGSGRVQDTRRGRTSFA